MGRIILIAIACVLLTGCPKTPMIRTEVQEVFVPIMHCPAPPEVERPDLAIHNMTPEQKQHSGEVVKHYKATIIQLLGYSQELEQILDAYEEGSQSYDEIRDELYEKLKQDGFQPPSE